MNDFDPALDTAFVSHDIGETTVREYLKALLEEVLIDGEGFSGKRPFGNSGWEYDIARPLISAGVLKGELDEEGFANFERTDWVELVPELVGAL